MEIIKEKEFAKNLIAVAMLTDTMLKIIDEHSKDDNITLKEIRDKWSEEYKVHELKAEKWHFINVHQYLITLLARIVLAQQFFSDEMSKLKISELPKEWVITEENIQDPKIKNGGYTLKEFITKLRNSISHGNIEIGYDNDSTFHFKDGKDKTGSFSFKCNLTYQELRNFIDCFNKWIANQYPKWNNT